MQNMTKMQRMAVRGQKWKKICVDEKKEKKNRRIDGSIYNV
jgi:hypothetical protein